MASIDTGTVNRGAPALDVRPVAPLPETSGSSAPKVRIEEIAARTEITRTEAMSEMDRLQERLKDAISTLNERMHSSQQSLSFSVDKASKRFVVTVTDKQSGEVIRHIPGESVLRVAHSIEALKGVLFEETV